MLGDRAVRFHAAGIARELSWVAGATALLAQIRTRLVDAYLAQPVKHFSPSTAADMQSLSAMLRHGDVLLTESNIRMAALPRRHYRLHVEACRLRQEQQPGVR
jgi:hypothetical protein